MNWHHTLEVIYSKLEMNGYGEVANNILDKQLSGATGGEIFDNVLFELLAIKKDKPDVYLVIKDEVDSFIDFGKTIGYL